MRTTGSSTANITHGQGRWFPAEPAVLRAMVDGFLGAAGPQPVRGELVGLIAPHAGYVYSGAVAGHAYRALRDGGAGAAPETVVVLGFCHRDTFPGIALMDGDSLTTPLGSVALDTEAAGWLAAASPVFMADSEPHRGEHSAENQVPFLQRAVPGARLVIALFGDHADDTVAQAAEALLALAQRRRIVVVASTDLLHDADYDRVLESDRQTVQAMAALDEAALVRRWAPRFQVCCGIGPVRTLLRVARGRGVAAGAVLTACNSGDAHPEGRGHWVVGYAALAYAAGGGGG